MFNSQTHPRISFKKFAVALLASQSLCQPIRNNRNLLTEETRKSPCHSTVSVIAHIGTLLKMSSNSVEIIIMSRYSSQIRISDGRCDLHDHNAITIDLYTLYIFPKTEVRVVGSFTRIEDNPTSAIRPLYPK